MGVIPFPGGRACASSHWGGSRGRHPWPDSFLGKRSKSTTLLPRSFDKHTPHTTIHVSVSEEVAMMRLSWLDSMIGAP